jgi:hypothetical protein
MSKLIKRQMVDKNGRLTTRWVREDAYYYPQSTATPPKPAIPSSESKLPRGAVKEMRELKSSITERLAKDFAEYQKRERHFTRDDKYRAALASLNEAFQNKEYDKMKVYEKHLSVEHHPEYLSTVIDTLRSVTNGDVADGFTDDFVRDFWKISGRVRHAILAPPPETIRGLSAEERTTIVDYASELLFHNPGSYDRIESFIIDRGIFDYDSLAGALEDSKEIKGAVLGGML